MARPFVGQRMTFTATFAYSTGAAYDPTTLEFRIRKPDLTIVTYDENSASVTNPVVGTWLLSYLIEDAGWHVVAIYSTTTPQEAVQQEKFEAEQAGA